MHTYIHTYILFKYGRNKNRYFQLANYFSFPYIHTYIHTYITYIHKHI